MQLASAYSKSISESLIYAIPAQRQTEKFLNYLPLSIFFSNVVLHFTDFSRIRMEYVCFVDINK